MVTYQLQDQCLDKTVVLEAEVMVAYIQIPTRVMAHP
jgi:hypothetical protein